MLMIGRDIELIDLTHKCLVTTGRPTSVLAGAKLFA